MSELLTLAQVAERLGCSRATVRRRVGDGSLPTFRDGRIVRVREDDLRRFVVERVARTSSRSSSSPAGVRLAAGARLWD